MAIPFFGDQAFWGEMCRRSRVGPAPIAVEKLTPELLKEGLQFLMRPEVCTHQPGFCCLQVTNNLGVKHLHGHTAKSARYLVPISTLFVMLCYGMGI